MSGAPVAGPPALRRDWPAAVALGALALALGAVAGPYGLLAGVATAAVWYGLGTPYAVAAGCVALLALFPDGIGPVPFALATAGLLAVVVAAGVPAPRPARFAAVAVASALGLGGLAALALAGRPVWVAAGVVLAALAAATYGLHRYELVALGLVPDATSDRSASPDHPTDT